MITQYKKACILTSKEDAIAHGVNLQNAMGSGVAKILFTHNSLVKEFYHNLFKIEQPKLGDIQCVPGRPPIINMFTQEKYGYDGKKYVDYDAIALCFKKLNSYYWYRTVAIPKIGCGLAGGDWNIVKNIINENTSNLEVIVYEK